MSRNQFYTLFQLILGGREGERKEERERERKRERKGKGVQREREGARKEGGS